MLSGNGKVYFMRNKLQWNLVSWEECNQGCVSPAFQNSETSLSQEFLEVRGIDQTFLSLHAILFFHLYSDLLKEHSG